MKLFSPLYLPATSLSSKLCDDDEFFPQLQEGKLIFLSSYLNVYYCRWIYKLSFFKLNISTFFSFLTTLLMNRDFQTIIRILLEFKTFIFLLLLLISYALLFFFRDFFDYINFFSFLSKMRYMNRMCSRVILDSFSLQLLWLRHQYISFSIPEINDKINSWIFTLLFC